MKTRSRITQNAVAGETFEEVLSRRLARRSFLKSSLAAVPAVVLAPALLKEKAQAATPDKLLFQPVPLGTQDTITLPAGYSSQVLLRWGDPLFTDSPVFDLANQSAAAQKKQFGYNNDFLCYVPLESGGRRDSRRGLLFVNHEYTNPELMFQDYNADTVTRHQVDIELAAHGNSVVEIVYKNGLWQVAARSRYNRRITGETRIEITGPAAGHDWLKTSYDQAGSFAYGTLNNCGGGLTPWGTILTCEENFNQYFGNLSALAATDPRKAIHTRYGLPANASERRWEQFYSRFDVGKEANEPFKFGWVVEVDPFYPTSTPRKRTALGRTKHEAATSRRPATDAANPRATNRHGHIIEMTEDRNDAAAETFVWNIFTLCGDPNTSETYFAGFDKSKVSIISSPDNITFDKQGNLWIATDGQPGTIQRNDGVYVVPLDGEECGYLRPFLSSVTGCETASLELTPNNKTLFVSIQHPGEGSTFDNPSSRFPDGSTPRPSVLAITRTGSGVIGG